MDWIKALREIHVPDARLLPTLSDEWWRARRGRLTAGSAAQQIHTFGRAIPTLVKKLTAELQPGWTKKESHFAATDWGTKYELAAIASIELKLGVDLIEPGMLFHPELEYVTATPDAFIDDDVTVQIKCPFKKEIHLQVFYGKAPKSLYHYQTQWEAWVSGRPKILFVSFDPRQPHATRLSIREERVDPNIIARFSANVARFKELLETGVDKPPGKVSPIGIPNLF